jgi:RNA polymerase sigma-70 factor (ECF subfamily)
MRILVPHRITPANADSLYPVFQIGSQHHRKGKLELVERSNSQWIENLKDDNPARDQALIDLRERLQRGIFFYLSRERSDLASLAPEEIQHMAQDFAQDAVLRVLDNLESFRGDSQFTTWAMKVAVRIAITELRRSHYRDYSLDSLTANGDLAINAAPAMNSTVPDRPEAATEKSDVLQKVDQAFREALTERQRQALQLLMLDGQPLEEVAAQMDTNRNALYKLVHDARRKLRGALEDQGLSPEYILRLFESQ